MLLNRTLWGCVSLLAALSTVKSQEDPEGDLDTLQHQVIINESEVEHELIHRGEKITYPYKESLDITPLPKNNLFTSFQFELSSEHTNVSTPGDFTHYRAFPRSLATLLDQTDTRDLHLRFGQGWWDSDLYGQLPNYGESAGGVGVEVWAVIEATNKETAFEKWLSLVNSLSGLFCASLNFIDSAKTIYPVRSFTPNKDIPLFDHNNELFLIRSVLAAEPVCTENLTPFVKFLPTRGKAGLASLLDGHRVFESEWHMMSIDIETDCQGDLCNYEMVQKIDAVIDIDRALRRKIAQIPKPVPGDQLKCDPTKPKDAFQCFPINEENHLVFTLSDLYGRTVKQGNLLSETPSTISVHTTKDWSTYIKVNDDHYGTASNRFELKENEEYDIYMKTENSSSVHEVEKAPVSISRSLTGFGQDKGGLRTVFYNHLDSEATLIYLESLPWFMKIYLHTLTVTGGERDQIIKSLYYLPEVDRERPTHIEFEIVLPPKSTIAISYQFDKSLLLIAEYPPDANHGFSVDPGVMKVVEPFNYYARTSPALLTLPTPDFSMPYNVIILTSTLMSLVFGTVFNLLFKRTVLDDESEFVGNVTGIKTRIRTGIINFKTGIKGFLFTKVKCQKQISTESNTSDENTQKAST